MMTSEQKRSELEYDSNEYAATGFWPERRGLVVYRPRAYDEP